MLSALLTSFPVLYVSPNAESEDQDYLTKDIPANYEYSIGVTLDYLPEENSWVASYSDIIVGESQPTPTAALSALQDELKKRNLW